ncbi:MAG TPA: hypothetical protein VI248_29885 [Kineosporiaceae bacterium]
MLSDAQIVEVKQRATAGLMTLPGVTMVAVGGKWVDGVPTGVPAIIVFVRKKKPLADLAPDEVIPAAIEGVPTDVMICGDLVPATAVPGRLPNVNDPEEGDDKTRRPLVGGARVAVHTENSMPFEAPGTLCCFVRHRADPKLYYLLTNNHVVSPPGFPRASRGDTKFGQPTGGDSSSKCCSDIVGVFAGGSGGPDDPDRDEALVQLNPGIQFTPEILDIGPIRGIRTLTPAEIASGTYPVRKRGARTYLTGGVIVAISGTHASGENVLVVLGNKDPSGAQAPFIYTGDSGAALVSDANEILGMLSHFDPDPPWVATAYAIDKVLERLATEDHAAVEVVIQATGPAPTITVPGATMVAAPPELAGYRTATPADAPASATGVATKADAKPVAPTPTPLAPIPLIPHNAAVSFRSDLERTRLGNLLLRLWTRHREELVGLVNGNRRVAVAWHRSGGSALVQTVLTAGHRPDFRIPATLNGVPLAECVDRLQEVFGRFGSSHLRADLTRARSVLPDVSGLSYGQFIDALDAG